MWPFALQQGAVWIAPRGASAAPRHGKDSAKTPSRSVTHRPRLAPRGIILGKQWVTSSLRRLRFLPEFLAQTSRRTKQPCLQKCDAVHTFFTPWTAIVRPSERSLRSLGPAFSPRQGNTLGAGDPQKPQIRRHLNLCAKKEDRPICPSLPFSKTATIQPPPLPGLPCQDAEKLARNLLTHNKCQAESTS